MDKILQILFEFCFLYLLQSTLIIYGIHLFNDKKIEWKLFIICVIITMVTTYVARMQLTFGNHTLFSLIIIVVSAIAILRIPAQKVVKSALILTIIVFIFEGIVFYFIKAILQKEIFDTFMEKGIGKIVAGAISNIMLIIMYIFVFRYKRKKNNQFQGD